MSSSIRTLTWPPDGPGRDVDPEEFSTPVEIRSAGSTFQREPTAGHTSEEATMQNVIATQATPLDSVVDSHEAWLHPKGEAGKPDGGATAHSTTVRLARRVKARDLHPGDIVQQYDWPLHVCEVTIGQAAVAIAVTEFGFQLHYAADEQVRLAG